MAHFGAILGLFFLLVGLPGVLLAVPGGLVAASRSLHRLGCVAAEVFYHSGHRLVAFQAIPHLC